MSKIDDAFEQVVGLAEKFKAILDVADEVKKIGSLEQATAERKAALDRAVADHIKAKLELDAVVQQVADAKTAYESLLEVQQIGLTESVSQAEAKAAELVADAEVQAQEILKNAHEQAQAAWDKSEEAMDARMNALNDIDNKIAEAQVALTAIKTEHDATAAAIDALKSAAKAVLA